MFFETIFSLPFVIFGIVSNYMQGTLSVDFAVEMVAEIAVLGVLVAVAVWFVITLPLKRKAGR